MTRSARRKPAPASHGVAADAPTLPFGHQSLQSRWFDVASNKTAPQWTRSTVRCGRRERSDRSDGLDGSDAAAGAVLRPGNPTQDPCCDAVALRKPGLHCASSSGPLSSFRLLNNPLNALRHRRRKPHSRLSLRRKDAFQRPMPCGSEKEAGRRATWGCAALSCAQRLPRPCVRGDSGLRAARPGGRVPIHARA